MKIFLVVVLLLVNSIAYADSTCEVLDVSVFTKTDVDGHGDGDSVHVSSTQQDCASVTMKRLSRGGSYQVKITRYFIDGTSKTRKIKHKDRISQGDIVNKRVCGKQGLKIVNVDCSF